MSLEPAPSANALTRHGDALFHQERFPQAIEAYSSALAIDPSWARAWVNRAVCHALQGNHDAANRDFSEAISRDPLNPEWRRQRATWLLTIEQIDLATQEFRQLLQLAPNDIPTRLNLSALCLRQHFYAESRQLLERLLQLQPEHPEALYNLGIALSGLGEHEAAQSLFRRCLAVKPEHVNARWNLSLSLLRTGQVREGWELFETRRRRTAPLFKASEIEHLPQLTSEHLLDRRGHVLVLAEQGLGDTLQFCRFLPALSRCGLDVSLLAQAPLRTLLRRAELANVIDESDLKRSTFDFVIPLMSLPRLLNIDLPSLKPYARSYLSADRATVELWRKRLNVRSGHKIGLVWRGKSNPYLAERSIDLAALLTAMPPQSRLFSLQQQLLGPEKSIAATAGLENYGDAPIDFEDTAALIELMDLVITIDTSIAHLAGALGKATWILLPYDADWRWMEVRSDSPWYPTARLIRPAARGDVPSILTTVVDLFTRSYV